MLAPNPEQVASQTTLPTLTVAIPAYNEAEHIEKVIQQFLNSRYPKLNEILIADGGSTDGTQAIVHQLSATDPRVKLIHNPARIQSAGLNLLLHEAKGDIFLRADAHCDYAEDYVEQCVNALIQSEALNAGGSQRYVAKDAFQAGVAIASKSWLTGIAKYRSAEYNGYADTVFLGCFWKHALLEIAATRNQEAFDTRQVRNQDLELNLRLRDRSPSAIYVSSAVKVGYFPRKTWQTLWQQYFKDGRGSYLTAATQANRSSAPLRQKLPFLTLFSLLCIWLTDLIAWHGQLYTTVLLSLIAMIPILEAIRITTKWSQAFRTEIWRGKPDAVPAFWTRLYFCITALYTMPIAYAVGYAYQLGRNRLWRIKGW
jgi:succinoglycan biosynthesis protein ExoA